MSLQNVKFSSQLLNDMHKLKYLVKTKNYTAARELQRKIKKQEQKELHKAERRMLARIEKMRLKKHKSHESEFNSIKARLEKSINSKLKQRMVEYEKLLLRIQNCHNDMANRQFIEFGRIQSVHAKLLSKYSLNLNELSESRDHSRLSQSQVIREESEYEMQSEGVSSRERIFEENPINEEIKKTILNLRTITEKQHETPVKAEKQFSKKRESRGENKENVCANTQGQINGYWNKQVVMELKRSTASDLKESFALDFSKDPEPVLSNFHNIPTEHISDRSETSNCSKSSQSSFDRSSSGSSSSSASESD